MNQKDVTISCPSCQSKNGFNKKQALNLKRPPTCKTCHQELLPYFLNPLDDLSATALVHPLDRQMLDALRKIPGIDSVLKTLLHHSLELSMRLHHQANYVAVSKKQLTSLYKKLEHAASILDMKELPELFVIQGASVNAYTFGVMKCSIAISSGCFELLSDDEITCVLAHELGHIKANHVLYKTATRILATLADSIAQKTLGLGSLVIYPLQIALLRWDRASELSSDRAALLVVKNPMTVLNTLMKLAGGVKLLNDELSIDAFIEQAENYEKTENEGPLGKYIAVMNSMFNSHPFPIWRAREIIEWVLKGDYFEILKGNYAKLNTLHLTEGKSSDEEKPATYNEKIDKALDSLRSWYDKNFNL